MDSFTNAFWGKEGEVAHLNNISGFLRFQFICYVGVLKIPEG